MRTKLLGIFESVQRRSIKDSRTATEKSVRVHHKELIFSVTVREVVTLASYLAMSASDLGWGAEGASPAESLFRRLDTRRGWLMGSMAMLIRLLSRKSTAGYHPEALDDL